MPSVEFNLLAGWVGMLAGALSGALFGLFFHNEQWMGGYGSFRRRLTRLGHISFFGLGFLNVLFGLSARAVALPPPYTEVASLGFIIGSVTMPLCCFLSAWRPAFRHLFPIPVVSIVVGILSVLIGWPIR